MNPLYQLWLGMRSTLFWVGFILSTLFYGITSIFLFLIPGHLRRFRFLVFWCHFNIWWLKVICGVKYQVKGMENIPANTTAIVMGNHQSTWETMALPMIFPPSTWVLKKELLSIPFFGWGVSFVRPVAIDRSAGKTALEQVKLQGKERLDEGIWIIIFPEGTRVKPGETKPYKMGGAIMATYSGYPVIPVVHNAGDYWPRHAYIKKPGTISVKVGKPISAKGKTPDVLLKEVQQWIETEKKNLNSA
ncbi:MAG: 1-acyl-sn-glycerol-3-phosphate acyltransferase [Proteobacteria bacterium]|nr:MAG: 1-acyl-sn-glycerol-3-phosphate acyltransferase [Pseudomonadota bacterium]